jgi:TolA-binding protein
VVRSSNTILMASLVLAITFSTSATAQQADPAAVANLVIEVQELQDEVRTLRGRIEEQSVEIENLKRRQRDQYLDLDQRLSDMRNSQPVMPSGAIAGSAAMPSQSSQAPEVSPSGDVPEVRAPMDTSSDRRQRLRRRRRRTPTTRRSRRSRNCATRTRPRNSGPSWTATRTANTPTTRSTGWASRTT